MHHRRTRPGTKRSQRAAVRTGGRARGTTHVAALTLIIVAIVLALGIASPMLATAPVLAQTNPTSTPFTLPTAGTGATATPTPRVIVVDRPTTTPTPRPAVIPLPTATTNPISVETSVPVLTATSVPREIVTPAPATATPRPAATATPIPAPVTAPTIAPAGVARLAFAAEDWIGGFYRGDSRFYGRPWVAVYGALSAYPRATLRFSLDVAPAGAATFTVGGLDDEWAQRNEMELEVNGARVFAGSSPFTNWDGAGNGADAPWTEAAFTIPAGALRAGANEIAVANLMPAASFNAPPYILLAGATLEIPRAAPRPAPSPTAPPIQPSGAATFAAGDWQGGFYQGNARFYGRPWVAVYGGFSDFPRATLTFRLDGEPTGPATLTVTGLDDELAEPNQFALEVNGQPVFSGPSPFPNWDGIADGSDAAWTPVTITLPLGLLHSGRNQIAIANLMPSANVNAPPYILLSDATVRAPGARITIQTRDGQRA